MKATQQLKDEHEGIKIMLNILGQICFRLETKGDFDEKHFEGILEFLKVFVDKCHHGKEEDLLFPALEEAGIPKEGGPIGAMLEEHRLGRNYISAMSEAFDGYKQKNKSFSQGIAVNGRDYIALLTNHIEKENSVLFVMADSRLSETIQDELFEGFEKIETERIGPGKHEEFHHLLEKLGKIYLD